MERHLLITVSEQKSALSGVQFAGNFLSEKTFSNNISGLQASKLACLLRLIRGD